MMMMMMKIKENFCFVVWNQKNEIAKKRYLNNFFFYLFITQKNEEFIGQ